MKFIVRLEGYKTQYLVYICPYCRKQLEHAKEPDQFLHPTHNHFGFLGLSKEPLKCHLAGKAFLLQPLTVEGTEV